LAKAATFKFSVHRINEWWIRRNRERPTPEIVAAFDGPWRPGKISKMLTTFNSEGYRAWSVGAW
jgi:hypothetical protein